MRRISFLLGLGLSFGVNAQQDAFDPNWMSLDNALAKARRCLQPEMRSVHEQVFGKLGPANKLLNDASVMKQIGDHYVKETQNTFDAKDALIKNAELKFKFKPMINSGGIREYNGDAHWEIQYDMIGETKNFTAQLNPFQFQWQVTNSRIYATFPNFNETIYAHDLPRLTWERTGRRWVPGVDGAQPKLELTFYNMGIQYGRGRKLQNFVDNNGVKLINLSFGLRSFTDCLRNEFPG